MKVLNRVKRKFLLSKFSKFEFVVCLKFYSYLDYLKILTFNLNCKIISFTLLKILFENVKKYSGGYYVLIFLKNFDGLNLIYEFLNKNLDFSLIFIFFKNRLYNYTSKNYSLNNNLSKLLYLNHSLIKNYNFFIYSILFKLLFNLKTLKEAKKI